MRENLPFISHPDCGPLSRSQVKKTKKGGYVWHCVICGETRFFQNLNIIECPHNCEGKVTKNGFLTWWCPICRIRVFKKQLKDELVTV